jgi:hypothetical protein
MPSSILFINGTQKQCGVYQYGLRLSKLIALQFNVDYREVQSPADYIRAGQESAAPHVIVNYHASVFPWMQLHHEQAPKIYFYLYHESNVLRGVRRNRLINTDPLDAHKVGFPLPRPLGIQSAGGLTTLPRRPLETVLQCPIVGSFGFGFHHKNFDKVVCLVQEQFDTAIIKIRMPYAFYGDADGHQARMVAETCRRLVSKPGIQLEISHDFLSTDEELCVFLSKNDLNIFLYDSGPDRGCSSVIDFALCVNRPIAISNSFMFRHIYSDAICVDKTPLRDILSAPILPHDAFLEKWSPNELNNAIYTILSSSSSSV